MPDMVRSKVDTGDYASDSEIILERLRALAERDEAVERWLRHEVIPAYERALADPSRLLTADQVRARLSDSARA